ncbi:MAG: ferrochelatase [Maricaulis sp.]|nr:ferrochelatase [Maricaulis sp.]HAQ36384.1 ferrochelatase [Alphaproteobacteria bacterium]
MGRRIAVVLFNLGGPDGPDDVRPFLRNLFRDPAIIAAPGPIREALAWFISATRAKSAKANYALMGGGSPLRPETEEQAAALTAALASSRPDNDIRCFIAMRYWHPFIEETVADVKAFAPDETVLLPLYPQFSTTTTGSSLTQWRRTGGGPARIVCCYPQEAGFIDAYVRQIRETWIAAGQPDNARLLLSAHGLPEKIIDAGDPYQWQVEQSCAAIAAALPELADWQVCYQSRVGPLKWIGPATDDAIADAARAGKHIIVVPVAFVSEHIETLVELDIEYAELAQEHGAAGYDRVPAVRVAPEFVAGLAGLVEAALDGPAGLKPPGGVPICPAAHSQCPCRKETA